MRITESQLRKIIKRTLKESYYDSWNTGSGNDLDYYIEKYGEEYIEDVLDDLGGDADAALTQLERMEDEETEQQSAKPIPAPAAPAKTFTKDEKEEIKQKLWKGAEEDAGRPLDLFKDFTTYENYFRKGFVNHPEYKAADKETQGMWASLAYFLSDIIYKMTD